MVAQNQAESVFSIEKVADEIHAGNDELDEWAAFRGKISFSSRIRPCFQFLVM
jgi:hypothetical protein